MHYSVLVLGDVEEALAPFGQEFEVDPWREHLGGATAWQDTLRRAAELYGTDLSSLADQLREQGFDAEAARVASNEWSARDVATRAPRAMLSAWTESEVHWDEEEKDWYQEHTWNPNRQWDWYQVGGLWSRELVAKPGARSAMLGDRSWSVNAEEADAAGAQELKEFGSLVWCDSVHAGELDFARRRVLATGRAEEGWARYQSALAACEETDEYQAGDEDTRTRMRASVVASELGWGATPELEWLTTQHQHWAPYAAVLDGEWVEGSEWEHEHPGQSWGAYLESYLGALDPQTRVSLVDCHN